MEAQRLALDRAAQTKEFDKYRMETDKTRVVLDTLSASISQQSRKLGDYKSKLDRINKDKAKAEDALVDAKQGENAAGIKNASVWLTDVKKGITNITKDIGSITNALKDLRTKQQSSQKLFNAANGKFKAIEKKFQDAHFKQQ